MKKLLVLLIILNLSLNLGFSEENLMIRTLELTPLSSNETQNEVESYNKGIELIKNAYFYDIDVNPYEKEIAKLASLDVISKFGDNNYYPSKSITGYEALGLLVRLRGSGLNVENRALTQINGLDLDGVRRVYNNEYLNEAITLGIINNDEIRELNNSIDRETFALWLSRTLGINTDGLSNVYSFKDFKDISSNKRNAIEALVVNNIMQGMDDGNFGPKDYIDRGTVAYVFNKALKNVKDVLNIDNKYGVIVDIVKYEDYEGKDKVSKKDIIVRNLDGTFSKLKTSYNGGTRQKSDFVSYKNDIVSDSRNLKIGDLVEYTTKDDFLRFVEVLSSSQLLSNINKEILNDEGLKKYYGTVGNISNEKKWENGKYINRKRYRIKNFDGQLTDILIDEDLNLGIKNDILVLKDGKFGGSELLDIGEDIEYLVKDNKIIYVIAKKIETIYKSGTIRNVYVNKNTNERIVTIFDYEDNIIDYPVLDNLIVLNNQNYGVLEDLPYGLDVKLTIMNGVITKIESDEFIENPAYIPKYGKVRFGEVYYIYSDSVMIELSSGEKNHFKVSSGIPIIRDGDKITFRALKEGDRVKVYFDSIYSNEASLIVVDPVERIIKQVYKGKLKDVNLVTNTITLNEVRYLKNKDWVTYEYYSKDIRLKDGVEVYVDGSRLKLEELSKLYKTEDVYVAIEDSFGKDVAVKINIKSGGERFYYDKIDVVDKSIGEMELNNQINFRFDDGTIVLKDSRILDVKKLKAREDAFVVASFNSFEDNYANIVKITSKADDIFENIYIGTVNEVHNGYFNMTNNATVSHNVWESVKEPASQNFYFNNDSIINDLTLGKQITFTDFFHDKYAFKETYDENSTLGLKNKRYYAVVVTDDKGQVIGLNMRQKGLIKGQNIDDYANYESDIPKEIEKTVETFVLSRGIVDEVQSEWNRIKLTDALDWVDVKGMWVLNPVDKYVEYDSAIIIKNGKIISYKDLEPRDYIYIMRSKEKALVIIVE